MPVVITQGEKTALTVAVILVIIGALVWGWIGLTSTNIVRSINNVTFRNEWFERIIYILVGIAGLYLIFKWGALLGRDTDLI